MEILDLKLAEKLESMEYAPIFRVFLDLRKSYDIPERGRLIQTLEGYGEGLWIQGLLQEFCNKQEVVTRQGGFHGPPSHTSRGTVKGGIASPTLFSD